MKMFDTDGFTFNMAYVDNGEGADVGINYEGSDGVKINKNYKQLDPDKMVKVVTQDLVSEMAKQKAKLLKEKKEEKGAEPKRTRIDELEEENKRLRAELSRLRFDSTVRTSTPVQEKSEKKVEEPKSEPAPKPKTCVDRSGAMSRADLEKFVSDVFKKYSSFWF